MSDQPLLSRRTVLAGAAGLLVSACTATTPPSEKEQTIFDLSLTERHRYRPFHVVAPGFVQDGREGEDETGAVTRGDRSPQAPFAAVEVDVVRPGGVLVAGLSTAAGDRVFATWNAGTRTAALEVRAGGVTRVLRRARTELPPGSTLGFVLCENQATVLVRTPDAAWRPVLTERDKVSALVDLRDPATLASYTYTWGVRSGSAVLGDVRAGLFGMTGLRDPHVVQHADGRPLVRDGKLYLTWTCAGLGFFTAAHWAVFTLDLADPTRLEQVAQLYSRRDGLLLGDHAGQLVRDGDRWLVATSSWGDFDGSGVHVRHLTTTDDLLAGVHLLETTRTELPTDVGCWDPGFTRIGDRWRVGFVESPSQDPFDFHPALAQTSAGSPFEGLERVGAADDLHQTEGPVLARVGDRWWFLASDGEARHYPVFDLQMRRVGRLDAPYPTNIPHPQLVQRAEELGGGWLMVTFDGTQYAEDVMGYGGHGDVVVLGSRDD
ncbi:hypothetical protein KRR39_09305 [Nocardioides panacis]|uniref:Uncharacterized protein n=1 Tax=Nocardioides panacis TaxID=2849501 RepID=A0A975T1J7_9ACTN|nr:hypothetical protein [Nocardioides panacis]QWZ09899.1 hypothetical protein KRR39_09305 [Nocardioides panacis]